MSSKRHINRNDSRKTDRKEAYKSAEERNFRERTAKHKSGDNLLPYVIGAGFGLLGIFGVKNAQHVLISKAQLATRNKTEGEWYTHSLKYAEQSINNLIYEKNKSKLEHSSYIFNTKEAFLYRRSVPYIGIGERYLQQEATGSTYRFIQNARKGMNEFEYAYSKSTVGAYSKRIFTNQSNISIANLFALYSNIFGFKRPEYDKIHGLTIENIATKLTEYTEKGTGIKGIHAQFWLRKHLPINVALDVATEMYNENPFGYINKKFDAIRTLLYGGGYNLDQINNAVLALLAERKKDENILGEAGGLVKWLNDKYENVNTVLKLTSQLRRRTEETKGNNIFIPSRSIKKEEYAFIGDKVTSKQSPVLIKIIEEVDSMFNRTKTPSQTDIQKLISTIRNTKEYFKNAYTDGDFQSASAKMRDMILTEYVDQIVEIKRQYGVNSDKTNEEIKKLGEKLVAGMTVSYHNEESNVFFKNGKDVKRAFINLINANGQVIKSFEAPGFHVSLYADDAISMVGNVARYTPKQSISGSTKYNITRRERQIESFKSLLPKFMEMYAKDPYKALDTLGDYFEITSTNEAKAVHTFADLIKSNHEQNNTFFKGIVNPNKLTKAQRSIFRTIGQSLQDYMDTFESLETGREAKILSYDTETFLLSGFKSDRPGLDFESELPKGWRGHAYSIAFNGSIIKSNKNDSTAMARLPEPIKQLFYYNEKGEYKLIKTPLVVFDNNKLAVKEFENPGQLLIRETIENVYKDYKAGSKSYKELIKSGIFARLQPTEAMQSEEGFNMWLEHVYQNRDKLTVKYKDIRKAMIDSQKKGWGLFAYNGEFDARRMNMPTTIDALGVLHGIGQRDDGVFLIDMMSKTSLGDIKKSFNITEEEIASEMKRNIGMSDKSIRNMSVAHFSSYDTALLNIALRRTIKRRITYMNRRGFDFNRMRNNMNEFSKLLIDIGNGKFVSSDLNKTLQHVFDSDMLMDVLATNDYESVYNKIAMMASSGATALGVTMSGNDLHYMGFFQEVSGLTKQFNQRFGLQMIKYNRPSRNKKKQILVALNTLMGNPIEKDILKTKAPYIGINPNETYLPDSDTLLPNYFAKYNLLLTPQDIQMTDTEIAMNEGLTFRVGDPENGLTLFNKFRTKELFTTGSIPLLEKHNEIDNEIKSIHDEMAIVATKLEKAIAGGSSTQSTLQNKLNELRIKFNKALQRKLATSDVVLVTNKTDDIGIRIPKASHIVDVGVGKNGLITSVEYFKTKENYQLLKILSAIKGVTTDPDAESLAFMQKVIGKGNVDNTYVSSLNYALRKKRTGDLYHGVMMNAYYTRLVRKFKNKKVTAAELSNEIDKILGNDKLFDSELGTDVFKTRLKFELGLLNKDDEKLKTVNQWVENVYKSNRRTEAIDVDIAYGKYLFDHINKMHADSGLVLDDKELDILLKSNKKTQLEYIKSLGMIFTASTNKNTPGVIDYNKYSKSATPLEDYINDHNLIKDGKKYLPSYLRPTSLSGQIAKNKIDRYVYTGLLRTYITEDLEQFGSVITPNSSKTIKLKPKRDIGFMVDLFRTDNTSYKEARRKARTWLQSIQKDVGIYNAFQGIKTGVKIPSEVENAAIGHMFDIDIIEKEYKKLMMDLGQNGEDMVLNVSKDKEELISELLSHYNEATRVTGKYLKKSEMPNVYFVAGKVMGQSEFDNYVRFNKLSEKEIKRIIDDSKYLRTRSLFIAKNIPDMTPRDASVMEKSINYFNKISKELAPESQNVMPIMTYKYKYQVEGETAYREVSGAFLLPHLYGNADIDGVPYYVLSEDGAYHLEMLNQLMAAKNAARKAHPDSVKEQIIRVSKEMQENIEITQRKIANNTRKILKGKNTRAQAISEIKYGIRGTAVFVDEARYGGPFKFGLNPDDVSELIASATTLSNNITGNRGEIGSDVKKFYRDTLGITDSKLINKLMQGNGYVLFDDVQEDLTSLASNYESMRITLGDRKRSIIAIKNDTDMLKEFVAKHPRKLIDEYSTFQLSFPSLSTPFAMDAYVDPLIARGAIGTDLYTRKLILKDWDSDQVVSAFAGVAGKNAPTFKRQDYLDKMKRVHEMRFEQLREMSKDKRLLANIDNGMINFDISTVAKRKAILEAMDLQVDVDKIADDLDKTTDLILARYRGISIDVGDGSLEVRALWNQSADGNKIRFYKGPKENTASLKSFMDKLDTYSKLKAAIFDEAAGKGSVPQADALAHSISNTLSLLENTDMSDEEFERFLMDANSTLDIAERSGIKSIKGGDMPTVGKIMHLLNNRGNADGHPDKNIQEAIEIYTDAFTHHMSKSNVEYLKEKVLTPAFKEMWKNPDAFTDLSKNTKHNFENLFFKMAVDDSLQYKAADSLAMMMGKYDKTPLLNDTITNNVKSMMERATSHIPSKVLITGGLLLAGAMLLNPNQTSWYNQMAPGMSGEENDRSVMWTFENPIRIRKNPLQYKNKQIAAIAKEVQIQGKMIYNSQTNKSSIVEDQRIRDASGRILSL